MNAQLTMLAVKYFAVAIVVVPVLIIVVYNWVLN